MNAQRLRANAQQMATNRLHSNSAGNANPSTGGVEVPGECSNHRDKGQYDAQEDWNAAE